MIPLIAFGLVCAILITKSCHIVPQKRVYIIERLGKYKGQLHAGFHFIIPFIDRIAYRHSLKEMAIDTPMQVCITRDNISVEVDGVVYLKVMEPDKAAYGINDYLFATTQIAQTTMRSVIGKLDLDQTFEERDQINAQIVEAADKASDPWGVKVTRYEIKDIKPPQSIKGAMEEQMRAERGKRATIATSEGEMQARINRSVGEKEEMIARSEGDKQRQINEAKGKAVEIEEITRATAQGIRDVANAINETGGEAAASLRVAEQYVKEFGKLAKTGNTFIIPAELTNISSMVTAATSLYKGVNEKPNPLEKLVP